MLRGKTAIVTGGSRGIGAAICRRLAKEGADIALIYAGNTELAKKVCQDLIGDYEVRAMAYQCDVADGDQVKEVTARIRRDFGRVDILVNNAGITRDGLVLTMKEEDYDAVLDTNLKGAFHMIRQVAGIMLRQRSGCIVNIASVSGILGNAGQCNYAASKAGLIGLTRSVARELAARGIRCNAVAPGFIATDMTKNLDGQREGNVTPGTIPLGRMGTPEEVAQAVSYLVQADYVTGQVLRVDGGIAM